MEDLYLIVEYENNENNSCHHHIRKSLDYLIETYNYNKISSDTLISNIQNELYKNINVHVLIFGGVSAYVDLVKFLPKNIKLHFIIDDIHHSSKIRSYRQKVFNNSTTLFLSYGYHFARFFKQHKQTVFLPHSAAYVIPFNDNPIIKILVSGHCNKDIYPNRQLLLDLSKSDDRITYFKPDYNGYKISEKQKSATFGIKYYELLNKYLACVADDSIPDRRYLVSKFFEIMASGSLLVAFNENTKDIFTNLGFFDNVHYISVNRENIGDKLNYIFNENNNDEITRIRKQGQYLVHNNHMYSHRAETIHGMITNKILKTYMIDKITNTQYISFV